RITVHAGRVTEVSGQVGQRRLHHTRVDRRGGVVIQVDGPAGKPGMAGSSRLRIRHWTVLSASCTRRLASLGAGAAPLAGHHGWRVTVTSVTWPSCHRTRKVPRHG